MVLIERNLHGTSETYRIKEKLTVQKALSAPKRYAASKVTMKDNAYVSEFDLSLTATNSSSNATTS